ncbi:MAG: ABC transporter substrate-binding protein [Acetobacteraceae bacterium]|nr:ABC transporter substrate-binding protein [Acetobacteraceae bacterium]
MHSQLPLTRRVLLASAAGALACPAIIRPGYAARPLVWVSWGGHTQDVQETVFIKPFMDETGIEVVTASGPDPAKIKAMVAGGTVEWDVVNLAGSMAMSLAEQDLLEPIDYGVVDASDVVRPDWIYPKSVGWYYYSGGFGYSPTRHPEGERARTWPEFFDVAKYPGKRGFLPQPDETLEAVLLGDGVAPDALYPLDIDRAFRALDRLKPNLAQFPTMAKSVDVIQTDEVDYQYTYSGRVEIARSQGVPVAFSYESCINAPSFQGIVKGSANRGAANRLLGFFMRVDRQRAWAEAIGYGPQKRAAYQGLSEATLTRLPSLDAKRAAWISVEWWGKNRAKIDPRFKEWMVT